MSTYAWVITEDHITEPGESLPSRVGTTGPHDATAEQVTAATRGRRWRVLDDDGIVYYSGSIWTAEDDTDDDFGPLWDFGTPDAGAVDIQYRQDGKGVSI